MPAVGRGNRRKRDSLKGNAWDAYTHVSDTKGVAKTLRKQQKRGGLYEIPSLEDLRDDGTPLSKLMQRHELKRPVVWDKGYFPIIEAEDLKPVNENQISSPMLSPQRPPSLTQEELEAKIARRPEIGSWPHLKGTVWALMEKQDDSILGRIVGVSIMGLICVSGIACVVETVPGWRDNHELWDSLEVFFVTCFTVEFLLRVMTCPNQWHFWTSPMNWVDIVAVFPFYVYLVLDDIGSGSVLRMLRLGRAFRLIKLSRYSVGFQIVKNALAASSDALQLFFIVLILVMIVFSSAIYYCERGEWSEAHQQYFRTSEMDSFGGSDVINGLPPEGDKASPFQSIPHSFWWCMVTLTTVGYGDVVPVTHVGQVVGAITMLVGLVMLALPLSIIGTNFIEEDAIYKELEHEEAQRYIMKDPNDRVKPLRNQVHALAVTKKGIEQADLTVKSQQDIVQHMEQALSIIDQMRKPLRSSGDGLRRRPSDIGGLPADVGLRIQRSMEKVPSAPDTMPGTIFHIEHKKLVEMEKLLAKAIDQSHVTMDYWDMELPPAR